MIKVGLTGNIASGKSEVEKILKNKGYFVVDLDVIVNEFYQSNEKVKNEIIKCFKTLDKKEISKIVFDNFEQKKELENIIYPELEKYILDLFKEDKEIIFVSGALLFESGFDKFFDKTVFVDCDSKLRLKRLIKRNNLSEIEAQKRINSQKDNKNLADYIIENCSDLKSLEDKVEKILLNLF